MTVKYEIVSETAEISYRELKDTIDNLFFEKMSEEIVQVFDEKSIAETEFRKYQTSFKMLSGGAGSYYLIERYVLRKTEYDEDGNGISSDWLEDTELPSMGGIAW